VVGSKLHRPSNFRSNISAVINFVEVGSPTPIKKVMFTINIFGGEKIGKT
jgi:hypothetical protein